MAGLHQLLRVLQHLLHCRRLRGKPKLAQYIGHSLQRGEHLGLGRVAVHVEVRPGVARVQRPCEAAEHGARVELVVVPGPVGGLVVKISATVE